MSEQTEHVIRGVAERLSDVDRGAEARRMRGKERDQHKYREAYRETQRRYRHDREALLAEMAWDCPFCGRRIEPKVYPSPLVQGEVYVVPGMHCGCQGERDAAQAEADRAEEERRAFDKARWALALSRAGLHERATRMTFRTFAPDGAKEAAWLKCAQGYTRALLAGDLGRKPWLVLYGDIGLGKTHLACAVIHEVLSHGRQRCYFRVWPEWLERLQGTFGGKGDSSRVVDELKSGDVVALDDIDKQHPTQSGWAEEKLFSALNHRYNRLRPTILTFNRAPAQMTPWLGRALVDRVIESAFAVVEFRGVSRRSGLQWEVRG